MFTHHRIIVPTWNMLFLHQICKVHILIILYASYCVIHHSYRIFAQTHNLPVFVGVWKHQEKPKMPWLRCHMKEWFVSMNEERHNWLRCLHIVHIPPRKHQWSSLYIPSSISFSLLFLKGGKNLLCCKEKTDFLRKNETDFSVCCNEVMYECPFLSQKSYK